MNIDNLLSGLFGAIIAVIITAFLSRLTTAYNYNSIRTTINDYLSYIGLVKTDRYIFDMKSLIEHIEAGMHVRYWADTMPVFNSEIFKSYQPHELRHVCYDIDTYGKMLYMFYSIDYLVEVNAADLSREYRTSLENILQGKSGSSWEEHYDTCEEIKSRALVRIDRSESVKLNMTIIHESLSGSSFIWIIKYLLRR